jgi:hypothetical protein
MTGPVARLGAALADRYVIERELGAGGMATVYLANDVKHERQVALKVLRPELGAVLGAERFLAEIKITARLDHPHILTLIDSGASEGLLYYVLPFVRGESLRHRLDREKQLGLEEALAITKQVASALDYAHRQGVVHRDIKPENILLQEGEAMLADFGIALAVKEAGGNRLTETGLSLGTPQYMSPEQATGDRTLDARSDVYSLGAVLYEMLTGEPPVTGPTVQAVIAKLLTERPTRVRIVRDTVPEGIDNAVAKALAKVPADRFASAGAFVAALRQQAAATAAAEPRRRMLGVLVAGAAVVAAAALGLAWWRTAGPARPVGIALDRLQLTFSGNATEPTLSPDGQRIAYATRTCDAAGLCTYDLVVQDIGGAGTATLARGFGALWNPQFTRDGRWLVVHASFGAGRWGLFSVPALGGAPRYLGCCSGTMIPGSDTALIVPNGGGSDSLLWLRSVTVGDGVVRDSVSIRWPGALGAYPAVFPDGRQLLLAVADRAGPVLAIVDRQGRLLDSLRPARRENWVPQAIAGGVVIQADVPGEASISALLRYAVDGDGRLAGRPDTLVARFPAMSLVQWGADGQAVVADGATEYSLWSLRRASTGTMRFEPRRLATATARLSGSILPEGERILVIRTVGTGTRARQQMSLMPFDSGPETPLGPPIEGLEDWDLSPDGRSLYTATRRDGSTLVIQAWDLATGRARNVAMVGTGSYDASEALPQGGLVASDRAGRSLRLIAVPGRPDTTITLAETTGFVGRVDPSPDGRHLATIGWDVQADSILVHRIELATGAATRLAAFSGEGWDMLQWLPGDVLQLGVMETAGTLAWYSLSAAGGRPVRMGVPPRYPASYRLSADGRRALARANDPRRDIYLIRNFGDLLAR